MPEPVGFANRFAAATIDFLVLFIVTGLLAIVGWTGFFVETLLPAAAVVWFWRRYGATPGKMAVSARIVDAASGGAPTLARLVTRYLAYLVSALPLFLGFVWIAIDRRRQGWHDKIARTMVVYEDD